MSRIITLSVGLLLSFTAMAQDLSVKGFNERFSLVKNAEGKTTAIRLKKVVTRFTIKPFLEQIKAELKAEQQSFAEASFMDKEDEVDAFLMELGLDPYAKDNGAEEARALKEALLNIPNINIDEAFKKLTAGNFWSEFQRKLQEAFMYVDPSIMANMEDARFFYKRNVTYKVVEWGLREVQKRFAEVPVINIATFVIVRVHDMMLEQRLFHHNMLLHYFETIPETSLGMTKEEVDRAVSSIYEYKIDATNIFESNRASQDWLNYGMNKFYSMVRSGNSRMRDWQSPLSRNKFTDVKKLNFAFASVNHEGARKIYHLHISNHQFTSNPALAYDYSNPQRIKRNRALLNLGGIALGFITLPNWIKSNVEKFLQSFYVEQVRMEGALVGYFESTGDTAMIDRIYSQRANYYILR